ncbi:MAG: SDR family oxidoreductase [Myxococcota bacterium]
MTVPHLFIFGLGYSAEVLAQRCLSTGWRVSGTTRSPERRAHLATLGITAHPFPLANGSALHDVTHVLGSIPPDETGDPVLGTHDVGRAGWLGYLSSTGVYGNHGGAWVDEDSALLGTGATALARRHAEGAWRERGAHIFRVAGIYGPSRSALDTVRAGRAQRLVKPGLVFSRIHVEDLAATVQAALTRPAPGTVYNVADDLPAPPQDVVTHACELLGVPAPPERAYAEVEDTLSPALRGFYAESRRVRNTRLRTALGVTLRFPDYRAGLRAILSAEREPE